MTFENITEKSVLNAAGRLVDPGKKIDMPVEYYAEHKDFVDGFVTAKKAKIGGESEYKEFLKSGPKKDEKKEKVDLMAEVQEEDATPAPKKAAQEKVAEPKEEAKAEPKVEEKQEEEPAPKKTSRRRKTAKTEDN
jgi:outer membrane biosynthesis protein TonB